MACAAAMVLHGLLWSVPVRWPRRLRLAVNLGLVVDAAWVTAVAAAAGGSRSPLVGLFLVTALWAALGVLGADRREGRHPGVPGIPDAGLVRRRPPVERRLARLAGACSGRCWRRRSWARRPASGSCACAPSAWRCSTTPRSGCCAASDGVAMTSVARGAAADLMPGWRVSIRLGAAARRRARGPRGRRGRRRGAGDGRRPPVGAIECRRPLPRRAGAPSHPPEGDRRPGDALGRARQRPVAGRARGRDRAPQPDRRAHGHRQPAGLRRRDGAPPGRGGARGRRGGPVPDGHRPLQGLQRHLRPPGRRRGDRDGRPGGARDLSRLRHPGAVRRRGDRRDHARAGAHGALEAAERIARGRREGPGRRPPGHASASASR